MNLRSLTKLPRQRHRHLAAVTDRQGARDTGPAADQRLALAVSTLQSMRTEHDYLQGMRCHPARDEQIRLLARAIQQCAAEIAVFPPLPADDVMHIVDVVGVAR